MAIDGVFSHAKNIAGAGILSLTIIGCASPPTAGEQLASAIGQCQQAGVSPQSPTFAVCVDKLVEDEETRAERKFRGRVALYYFGGLLGVGALLQFAYWVNPALFGETD